MRAQSPDIIVNLGDLFTGPFDPIGSADLQIALGCPTLAGNHERNLLEGDDTSRSVAFARPLLSPTHMEWIRQLPTTLQLASDEVFACHGSPAGGDLDYLLEDVSGGRAVLAAEDAIRPRLAGVGPARLVLCGHTHVPRLEHFPTKWIPVRCRKCGKIKKLEKLRDCSAIVKRSSASRRGDRGQSRQRWNAGLYG